MAQSVEHFLNIYRVRKSCQDEGITNPPEAIKAFTTMFVKELEQLESDDLIEIRKPESGNSQFILISTGKVLAEIPKT